MNFNQYILLFSVIMHGLVIFKWKIYVKFKLVLRMTIINYYIAYHVSVIILLYANTEYASQCINDKTFDIKYCALGYFLYIIS